MSDDPADHQPPLKAARAMTLALLDRRGGKTLCPSEVAKALVGGPSGDWRGAMPLVHAAVDQLHGERQVRLGWKGALLTKRTGPYRIARETEESTPDGQR